MPEIPNNKEPKEPQEYLTREETLETFDRSIDELGEFFEINWVYNRPECLILDSRKEMDEWHKKSYGTETQDWMVGFANGNRKICLLNHKNLETESRHKYTKPEYAALVKHETCHLFFGIMCKKDWPRWLDEGTSIFLADQLKFKKGLEKFEDFLDATYKTNESVYKESGFAVELLIKNFGKDKYMELLKANRDAETYEDFKKKFEEIYGFELNYDEFNKLLKNNNVD